MIQTDVNLIDWCYLFIYFKQNAFILICF